MSSKQFLKILVFAVISLILQSCSGDEDDIFQIRIINPYNFDIELGSDVFEEVRIDANSSEILEAEGNKEIILFGFEPNCDDCSILGEQGSNPLESNITFNFEAGVNYKWTVGDNEVYKDDGIEEINDCGDYNGPDNIDNQYDYQCQAAYAYYCGGNTEALSQQCEYYKSLQQELGLPDCDYCD